MSTSGSENAVLLTRLADEFAARYRRGERPSLTEYVERYPQLAADICEVFPALVEVEQVKDDHQQAAEQTAASPALALQQLGDFRILREVGKGGMGIVYEAEQVSLGRHVALKVLPKSLLPDARAKRRFEREAKAAAKLHHTNIVPVFGVGEQDGMPYYVMQFIQGLGLDEVLDELKKLQLGNARTGSAPAGELRVSRKELSAVNVARSLLTGEFVCREDNPAEEAAPPIADTVCPETPGAASCRAPALSDSFTLSSSSVVLPGRSRDGSKARHRKQTYWQSVASIGVQVAEALEYAHKQGIQHRDIKPSNLLLDTQGTVWVTDFGLAKADDQQNLTHTGDILGTLRYMPPEAFEGRSDARGDVYSLGLTLYEMLAFRPAFEERDRNRLIKQVTQEEPARLGKLNRAVPRDLETIVHKAIDKDAKQRYASAGALAEDLQRFIEDEPIKAQRVSPTERVRRWCRRSPLVASLAAALALVFLAGFAGVAWKWQEAERQRDIAGEAGLSEAAQRVIAEEQADTSRRLLYASDMNLAGHAWEVGDTGRARDLLERQRPRDGQDDLRGFEWRYLWRLCQDGSRQTLRGHTGAVGAVALAPDGKTLATSGWDHSIRIWDLASQRHVRLVLINFQGRSLVFAPDGKTLAIAGDRDRSVRLWDVAARCERASFPHRSNVADVTFSPDGKLLATACGDRTVRLWEVATRREVGALEGHPGELFCVRFSPDGKTLASGGRGLAVRLWDVAARRLITTFEGHTASVTFLSFAPDGRTLASGGLDGTVRLWDTANGQEVTTLRGQRTMLNSVAFSPDGKVLATGGGDGTLRLWDRATNRVTGLLQGHTSSTAVVAFAPDGRSLVSRSDDGTIKVWDVGPRPDPNTLTDFKAGMDSLAISPDGKTLAVGDYFDKTVKLYDLASRQRGAILRGHEMPVWFVTFAPGGQNLASTGTDGTILLWDLTTKERVAKFQHHSGVFSASFSPDARYLAAGGGGEVLVWEIATRQQVAKLPGVRVLFSPDGTLLAARSGNTVRLWEMRTWQDVAVLKAGENDSSGLAFAPDGRILATGAVDGTLRLWDVAQKRQIASSRGHAADLYTVAFSPDGRRLATAGNDSTVKLWDVALLQEVATFTGHHGPVWSVAFSADGNTLATASSDATARLWQAPPLPEAIREPADAPSVPPPVKTIRLSSLELFDAAQGTLTVEGKVHKVDVTAVDGTIWHAQLCQMFDDLQEGATYTVRFRAKADTPRRMKLWGEIAQPDWHCIGLDEEASLTEDWQTYQYQFQAKNLTGWTKINFRLGNQTGTVWIADFTLTKGAK
jgi:WD40 repeat protein/serine/threonine protein kinase